MPEVIDKQELICVMCGKKAPRTVEDGRGWHFFDVGAAQFEACPRHFEKCDTWDKLKRKYKKVFLRISQLGGGLI